MSQRKKLTYKQRQARCRAEVAAQREEQQREERAGHRFDQGVAFGFLVIFLAVTWYSSRSLAVAVTLALWLRLLVRLFLLFLLELPSALKRLTRSLGRRGATAALARRMLSEVRARHAGLAQRIWLIVDVALVSATLWLAGAEGLGIALGLATLCAVVPAVVLLLAQPFIGRI